MKIIRILLSSLTTLVIITVVCLYAFNKQYILTGIKRTYLAGHRAANINDYSEFEHRSVAASNSPQVWPLDSSYNKPLPDDFRNYLEEFDSVAFLVAHNGNIVSENYFKDYHKLSKTNSFSMAKTVVTLLIGAAIEDGYINSLEQKISDFYPEFADDPLGKHVTVGHLSNMTSGYAWDEHYHSPLSPMATLYYDDDVESFLLDGKFTSQAGEMHYYSSASTQLLGILLRRTLQKARPGTTVSDYLSEKLWQPLGMNDDAQWHLDGQGMELVYCCLNSNARNFAKLGQLMLNRGRWNNQQLIPAEFIDKMLTPTSANGKTISYYGYSTWLNQKHQSKFFWFSGHLGQYIICIPEKNIVIVRLGERRDTSKDFRTNELYYYVEQAFKLLAQHF